MEMSNTFIIPVKVHGNKHKKVGKPYNVANDRHVIPTNLGEGVPLWGGH